MSQKHESFSIVMKQLVHALVGATNGKVQAVRYRLADKTGYAEETVRAWSKGTMLPSRPALTILLRIGREEATLDRAWGAKLVRAAGFTPSETRAAVNDVWGDPDLRSIPHNLPPPAYREFVGRETEQAYLLKLISPRMGITPISVDGIGGVGKTALALSLAYRCLDAATGELPDRAVPMFDAIIFASAKTHLLTPRGISHLHLAHRTLRDIVREIAHTLGREDITTTSSTSKQYRLVQRALMRQRTLLIVDNLETVADKHAITTFLQELPSTVKVIITTRDSTWFSSIHLEQLPEEAGLRLLRQEAEAKGVELLDRDARLLYERTSGVPAAMVYAIGQLADRHILPIVLERLADRGGDVAHFCFTCSVAPLRQTPAYQLLMAAALFPKRPLREAIIDVAGLRADMSAATEALAQLERLSLITLRSGRYMMLPLTREYILAELAADRAVECEVRERWVEWYRAFAEAHGGEDWKIDWHVQYDRLEEEWENLLEVFDWCAAQERYSDMLVFWQGPRTSDVSARRGGVLGMSHLYGYWLDRLGWLRWLIQAAERRGDWRMVVGVLGDTGFTLTLMGQEELLAEADSLLLRGWNMRTLAPVSIQAELAQDIGILRLRQKRYGEAAQWLDRTAAIFQAAPAATPQRIREWIPIPYYRGEICYRTGDLDQAQIYYQEVIALAQQIGWQRAENYAQNWLGDIAIEQGNLSDAEAILSRGLAEAEQNNDKRRTAHYKRSLARLAYKRGDTATVQRWASEAYVEFERLGMQPEAIEMSRWRR